MADRMLMPLTLVQGERVQEILTKAPSACVARLEGGVDGVLCDAVEDPAFREAVLRAMAAGRSYFVSGGELRASATGLSEWLDAIPAGGLTSSISKEEQTNTSVMYGDRVVLKFFRRSRKESTPRWRWAGSSWRRPPSGTWPRCWGQSSSAAATPSR